MVKREENVSPSTVKRGRYGWLMAALAVWLVTAGAGQAGAAGLYVGWTTGVSTAVEFDHMVEHIADDIFIDSTHDDNRPFYFRAAGLSTFYLGIPITGPIAIEGERGHSFLNHSWNMDWNGAFLVYSPVFRRSEGKHNGYFARAGYLHSKSNLKGVKSELERLGVGIGYMIGTQDGSGMRTRLELFGTDFAGMPGGVPVLMFRVGVGVSFW